MLAVCLNFLFWAASPAYAAIAVNGILFDSLPAMFGATWEKNIQYQARLQELPARPYLCEDDRVLQSLDEGVRLRRWLGIHTSSESQELDKALPVALLVRRGECSFEKKAKEAVKIQNVDFVIVYDDRPRTQLVPMSASNPNETTAHLLFVSHSTGLQLRQMLRQQSNNTSMEGGLLVTMDSRTPNGIYAPAGYDDTEEWIMAAMSGFFAFLACIGCLLVCVQAGVMTTNERSVFTSERLMTEEQVLKLPTVAYDWRDDPAHQQSCAVCIEEFAEGDKLRQLPCGHVFHTECIVPWLTERHTSCPLCKADVLLTEETPTTNEWFSSYGSLLSRVLPWRHGRILVAAEDVDIPVNVAIAGLTSEEEDAARIDVSDRALL